MRRIDIVGAAVLVVLLGLSGYLLYAVSEASQEATRARDAAGQANQNAVTAFEEARWVRALEQRIEALEARLAEAETEIDQLRLRALR